MPLPIDLVLVRHGESEANRAWREVGEGRPLDEHHFCRPDALVPLTPEGREQAERAGRWLRAEFPDGFTTCLASTYARAQETAALLDLPGARWRIEPLVRELPPLHPTLHEVGAEEELARVRRELENDRLHFSHLGRESVANVTDRLRVLLLALGDGTGRGRAIVVAHAGVLSAARIAFEGLDPRSWEERERSSLPEDQIVNCQVFHYTRRDPTSGSQTEEYSFVRRVRAGHGEEAGAWEPVGERTFSSEELLEHSRTERAHLTCLKEAVRTPTQRGEQASEEADGSARCGAQR